MTSLYGKCVGITKNSESDSGTSTNCKWKSDNPNFELATFGNIKVSILFALHTLRKMSVFDLEQNNPE